MQNAGGQMDWITQVAPLAGVVVGATASFVAGHLTERSRWRRSQSVRWDEKRLLAYLDYLATAKSISMLTMRVVASRGVDAGVQPIDTQLGLTELDRAEGERSTKFEGVLLLGDTATARAAQNLNEALWGMHRLARQGEILDADLWWKFFRKYREARVELYAAARRSMGVPAADIPLSSWQVPGQISATAEIK